ncbi:phage capsid protein [Marinilactibacillus psychrotolerans]|uniref:phage major capsid protein n=1 Tax=Marinilactibacillus psychrotolerans TaxID=191770 RepID=UPI001C7DAB1B|nr:phage major capsid protein [Marinilactibacillus psychrotolerans]GEQ32165.1 phage capsid protein [Marinilactibacillus psychrotolerans]
MANPVILGSKIRMKRSALEEVNSKLEDAKKREEEVLKAIDDIENEEDLAPVEKEVEEIQAELEAKTKEKTELEKEIEELEATLEAANEKEPTNVENEGDERNMVDKKEMREGIKGYVRSKGATRDGFTSVEGGALIPEELLTPVKAPEDEIDLTKFVNVTKVNSGSGKYPVIKKSNSKMVAVAELEKNPELAKPNISQVAYDIETYRGYIPVSQEVIDDANYDVVGMIADEIKNQELNTKNCAIAAALKTATAKDVTGVDGLKAVLNVELKKVYAAKFILSASLFNELDTTKDLNGRYLLQDDITVESGKKLFGKEVVVLDDDMIGTDSGDLVGFIGDPKAFATVFDRKSASVKWVDNDVYGQLLAGFVRFDAEVTDTDAGFYVTYTPESPAGA